MADVTWIKLTTTMFDDEKIRLIQSMPESDATLVIWIRLLTLAGKTNDSGLIYIQRNMPYTEEMLATLFGKDVNTVRLAINTLAKFDMIDIQTDGLIAISNWEKHQNIEGMEKIREQNRLRKQKQREKQAALPSPDNVTGQSRDGHATEEDKNREDKNREDNNNNDYSSPKTAQFELIWKLYPKKQGKEKAKKVFNSFVKCQADIDEIKRGVINYAEYCKVSNIDPQFIKQGSTYFNNKCWQDEYDVSTPKKNGKQKESKPDWVGKENTETPVSDEAKREFEERIAALRKQQESE